MIYEEKTVKSDIIYEGRILNLRVDTVELPNRKYSKREIVEHGKAVALIPVKEDKIIFVRQHRIAVDRVLLELPAGLVEANEEPRETALREMQEEIGYASDSLEYLFDSLSSPGFTNEKTSYFLAKDLYKKEAAPDEDEFLEVEEYTLEEALDMIDSGEIIDSKTIIGILYAAIILNK